MKLINNDCLIAMQDIPDKSIDLTVTSPPYDNLRTYNNSLEWGENIWKPVIKELFRITKDGGVVVWVVGDATIKGSETGTSFKQALYFKEVGFNIHDTMIYQKNNFSNPSTNRYHQIFEYMFIFNKGHLQTFNSIKDRKNILVGKRKVSPTRRKDGSIKRTEKEKIVNEYGQRYNIWIIPTTNINGHPAPFPEKLAQDHIYSWSNENDMVLDCFMGSGTTGVVCKRLNRNFIGIEKDENYFNIAKERIEKEQVQLEFELEPPKEESDAMD